LAVNKEMTSQFRVKGFVFKKEDSGEADRVFTIFTYDFGRLDIYAKAIRKINSKLRAGINIFCLSEIEFVQGKKKTLTDAILINNFPGIKKSPRKFLTAQKIARIIDDFIKGQEHDKEIFNLLIEIFEKLENTSQVKELEILYVYFLWNFLAILGYSPEVSRCVNCRGNLNEKELYFSFKEGGLMCKSCLEVKKNNIIKISSGAVKILRIILKKDWQTLLKLKINSEEQKFLNNISKNYYLYLLPGTLFSKHK
jgi:DNA repair protein RecO (recombination protein O)